MHGYMCRYANVYIYCMCIWLCVFMYNAMYMYDINMNNYVFYLLD